MTRSNSSTKYSRHTTLHLVTYSYY